MGETSGILGRIKALGFSRIGILGILCVLGVLLLLWGNGGTKVEESAKSEGEERNTPASLEAYARALEERIEVLCEGVSGVSDVRVAVTLTSGYEYVYAKDTKNESSGDRYSGSDAYLTVGNGASEGVVYLSEKLPVIGGIGIVCRGGGDANVRRELIELISAAFGVPSNKIYVADSG